MRVFQLGNIYPVHLDQMRKNLDDIDTSLAVNQSILANVPHAQLLEPCINEMDGSAIHFPQYERGLRLWAAENGFSEAATLDNILLAQIEHVGAEIFYSINATRHSPEFLKNMPGCVRLKIGWLGSPSVGAGLAHFDAVVSCYPTLNALHRKEGMDTHYLAPSYETQTDRFFDPKAERQVDVFFAGAYSRHHKQRAKFIEAVADSAQQLGANMCLHLLNSRYTRLAESTPLGWFEPFKSVRRPKSVRQSARAPIFGVEMLEQLCASKVVINMAIDVAGADRGNMRCFEALSAGALMISDDGDFPEGFVSGETHLVYNDLDHAIKLVEMSLAEPEKYQAIGLAGAQMMRQRYSKKRQWDDFVALCESLVKQREG